jgi:hypothetical protein
MLDTFNLVVFLKPVRPYATFEKGEIAFHTKIDTDINASLRVAVAL